MNSAPNAMPFISRSLESNRAFWAFAALGPFAIYGVILALLGIPFIQKQLAIRIIRGHLLKHS